MEIALINGKRMRKVWYTEADKQSDFIDGQVPSCIIFSKPTPYFIFST